MYKKIDLKNVCEVYNKLRMENVGRQFSSDYLIKKFVEKGLSKNLAKRIIYNSSFFKSHTGGQGQGRHISYMFPSDPIHHTVFEKELTPETQKKTPVKKDVSFEEECAEYLKKQGYQLKKCVGFDEDKFSKDYPQLYAKYLMYEII